MILRRAAAASGRLVLSAGRDVAMKGRRGVRACYRKHNMYDYLEICGWMVDDEKEWRAWKSGL